MIFLHLFYHRALLLLAVGTTELIRYGMAAGGVTLVFYGLFRKQWLHRKIVEKYPAWNDVGREIILSIMTCMVYAIVGLLTFALIPRSWNHYYLHIRDYGIAWLIISIVLTIFLHDAYFYWTHRLMHHPKIYRIMHRAHHVSTNPTPWAAYSFDPIEAIVQAGIFPLACMLYPLHPLAMIVFMLWQVSYNALGHSGHEFYPSWFLKSWLGKFLSTATNHTMHHEYFRGNYGLYFNLWDRWMGTNHPEYERRFAEVTSRPRRLPEASAEPAEVPAADAPALSRQG